jgi:hypothetical protein
VLCPKCKTVATVETTQSCVEQDKWIVKWECTNPLCHARAWERLYEAERIPVPAARGMVFSRNKGLKCEICSSYTDILHPHTVVGDKDYLCCGECKNNFEEAERLCDIRQMMR